MSKIFILGGYGYTGKFLAKHLLVLLNLPVIFPGNRLNFSIRFQQ